LLKRSPTDAELLWLLGNCRANRGDTAAAEQWLRSATVVDPERAAAWRDLGSVLNVLGRRDEAIQASAEAFRLDTERGTCRAQDVVVATNGYTGKLTPWLRRRVIPIGSYMIATEPLPRGMIERLIPKDRIVSDTRKVVYYYRASPDRRRILFGGRVSHRETDPRVSGPRLHADMANLFPELASIRVSHSWMGFVAYTFDELAHIGQHEGLHYAMGYCGSGVGMASYLGMRLGQQVLGLSENETGFHRASFQTRPLYTGTPWFLAASVLYYRWQDGRSARV